MKMNLKSVAIAATSLLAAVPTANAHTWVEFLYHISSTGTFTGKPGYPIGYIPRSQGVSDDVHQTKILDTSTNPAVCKPLSSSDAIQYPPLQAAAGDYIALQYQENGHVTQPELTVRPYRGGNVYVYGTLKHQDTDGINDVLNSWTVDGKGGNKKGKLIATHYFDDGQCFQDAPGNPIAQERKAKYGVSQLFCQTDIQLPTDLPSQGTYTLIWVWNWPRIDSDSKNVTEIYTSCAQIDLGKSVKGEAVNGRHGIKFSDNNKIESAAISSQVHNLIEATALGIGTNSPPAPTGLDDVTSAPQPTESSTKSKDHDRIKTVTVTAKPDTVTEYYTVTKTAAGQGDDITSRTTSTITSATASLTSVATSKPTSETTSEPTSKPTSKTPSETPSEATSEPTSEPTSEATSKPTSKATSKATSELTSEATSKATSKPTSELTSQPTSEPTSVASATTPAVTSEPSSEPTSEATSELTSATTSAAATTPATTTVTTSLRTSRTITSPVISFPTSFIPVTSVDGFLKLRGARVTGHARRDSSRRQLY